MNDFEFDVKQKKQIARSARYKVVGSKSKSCHLRTDIMTKKELEAMNGKMITYNMDKPISWEDFCALHASLQKEYAEHLITEYGANYSALASMFHRSRNEIRQYLQRPEIGIFIERGNRMQGEKSRLWNEFLSEKGAADEPENPVNEEGSAVPEQTKEETTAPGNTGMQLSGITLNFDGEINIDAVSNSLKLILGKNINGRLEIMYSAGEGA